MAAEPTRIKLKRSTTATVVPTTSNLADGEVAVNIADRKIYVRNGGSIVEVANQKPNTGEVTTTMLATDITNGPGQTYYVAKAGSDSTTLANGGANGKHQDTPFLTVAKALSTATSGDTVYISPGTYTETFPLTIPDGVTLRGAGIRSVLIQPSPATNTQNGFVLNGDTHISDLTIGGILYNAGLDRGYAIVCASNWDAARSAYVERVTVLNRGSVTSLSDPYGFAQGDAGRGAKLDGSVSSASSYEAAVLFNECTFFTPNQIGLYMTNGIRVELLNSFFYFASEAIKGAAGATGVAGNGRTRLKIGGVSGTFSAGETIYELSNNFVTGSYTQSGTTITVTSNAHGLSNGDHVYADFTSGTAVDGFLTVSSAATNTFVLTAAASATTSGNVQYKEVLAYGLIDENDGTYLYLDGKGNGEFSSTASTAKTAVTTGDAKLSTAQFKFGTASLLLDGTGDYISYPTNVNFGFGLGDFTIECFTRFDVVNDNLGIFDFRAAAGSEVAPLLYLNASGRLVYQVGATARITGGNTLSVDTWYHVAVSRIGDQTKLFVNGVQEGSTYTDANDYGSTKQLQIGSIRNANYEFDGYIDEVRISKGIARYTSNFTAPTAAFAEDIYTVLLLHLDGANASTTILDSSGSTKDIRSSGGDSATTINLVDYTDFGAELRSIGCAAVYGTKAVVADGLGVVLRLTAANFEYIGTGADITNNAANTIQANEITELNGGRIYYTSQDQSGNFRVGDLFVVDQELGNVTFSATTQNAQSAASITLSDGTGTTNLYPAYIETGNLRLSGNTLSSTTGNIIVDPSSDEDILLNSQVIIPEQLYFDNTKLVSIDSKVLGGLSFGVEDKEQAGFSSYGLFSNKNFTVFSSGLDTISLDVEGSGYTAQQVTLEVLSSPQSKATGTVTLDTSNGSINTVNLTNAGSGYVFIPDVTIAAPASPSGTQATAQASFVTNSGRVVAASVSSPGSGYTSPTVTFATPPIITFNVANVDFSNNRIPLFNHTFVVNDRVVYGTNSGSQNIGLTDGQTYYVISTTAGTITLSATQGGPAINLIATSSSETHTIRGKEATGTLAVSSGEVSGITITYAGTGYTGSPTATITDSTGQSAAVNATVGYRLGPITVQNRGSGYTSNPSVSFANQLGDTTGAGAAASTTIGYPLATASITYPGRSYSIAPEVVLSGGNPISDAQFEVNIGKKSGILESISITNPGQGYTTVPTLEFVGGSGSDGTLEFNILPFDGSITVGGSGYSPGIYNNIPITGGGVTNTATATITVVGLGGTLVAGSNYFNGNFSAVNVRNTPTSTYTVTSETRELIKFRYDDQSDYVWDVTNNATSDYTFTRTSPTGTASGNDISITAEVGDTLTFNVNASGHPFYIQTSAAPFNFNLLVPGITNNGTQSGTITWDLRDVDPGTYYYVCGIHPSMSGTITVSAYSGSTFSSGDTITGASSGASATSTFVGDYIFRAASVTGGPFTDGETIDNGSGVTATVKSIQGSHQQSVDVFLLNGSETPSTSLLSYNSYNFDLSDSSLSSFSIQSSEASEIVFEIAGSPGTSGCIGYLTIKSSFDVPNTTLSYGSYPLTGNYFTVTSGSSSQGSYGYGATVDLEIIGGSVDTWTWNSQGSEYNIGDVLVVHPSFDNNGNGSGASFTVTSYDTSISSLTNISNSGGPYTVGSVLSVDPTFDGVGSGSGFEFTLSKSGYVDSVTVVDPGFGYSALESLVIYDPNSQLGSYTTEIDISVSTVSDIIPIEIAYDGSITSQNWSITKSGNTNLGTGSITCGSISSAAITASGTVSSPTLSSQSLNVSTSASIANLVTTGSQNNITQSSVKLRDGLANSPTLSFQNDQTSGLFRENTGKIVLTHTSTSRIKVSASDIETTNNIKVDSVFGATTPFFFVNATGESVDIGAPETGIRITNSASIEAIGSDVDVDITFIPKGTGNLILTGGANKDFSITDGSIETFRVDTESGNTTIKGRLDVNDNLRIDDNIISNSSIAATTSFGQIITISVAGIGTGYANGTYTAVTSTTSGSGSGATFDVIVSGGDIASVFLNAGGAGYAEGDTITLNPATIGAGTGKTITITDIEGAGIVIKPQTGKNVKIDSTAMFVVPAGNTNQRPAANDRQTGGIRFNTQQQQFEGYNGTDFVSLGGVRDVNQDTYILTELAPGSNEDTFFFYNFGVNSLDIVQDKFKLYTAKTFDTYGTLTLNGVTFGSNPLDVQTLGSSVFRVRSQKDVEVTGGLRFKSVPVLGEITTIGTVTSGVGVYTASQTFTAVASTSQFEGNGATFTVVIDGAGSVQSVTRVASGSDYEVGEIVTIGGNLLGGATPANDVTFPVATIANTSAPFARLDILQQDYVTQLDNKPFLSLDANGAEVGWKINRGWNSNTESYLTVFDSTATFMELDDCRVEGGQLSSFASNSTIVQFDKTTFKGAKTLVTIESDDGKVHMLEVTTVCAAAGTTAHATVTNSVTSDNDLVDATVTVVGNNVNISLNKSSAATSSSSFTGRYTTTKVKV
jgi:plastocyanin